MAVTRRNTLVLRFWACLVPLWAACAVAAAQEAPAPPIEIINTDLTTFDKIDPALNGGKGSVRKLLGNVQVRQDTITLWCDSAYYYKERNLLEAMSRVHIQLGSSTDLYADRMDYDGNTKIVEVYDNIRLTDGRATLLTNRMTYHRNGRYGYYQNAGTLVDSANRLTSLRGFYYSGDKVSVFKDSVRLYNPDYTLYADSLRYQTESRRAIFVAPTNMYGKKQEHLYTERGYYLSKTKEVYLYQNPYIQDTSYTIWADTIFYNDPTDRGWAHCNVQMLNKDSTLFIGGERGIFKRRARSSLITENPFLLQIGKDDTLSLFADTLFTQEDTVRYTFDLDLLPPSGTYLLKDLKLNKKYQPMRAYRRVRFSMRQMQGKADSLEYERVDSVITFYRDPLLWAEENQVSGDTIRVWMKRQQADSMRVYGNAFVASRENARDFNQIQGDQLYAKFRKNKMYRLLVDGQQSEAIYYTKDNDKLTGMNQTKSKSLLGYFKDGKPYKITLINKPEGVYSPMHEIALKPNRLKRFDWRAGERPLRYLGTPEQNERLPEDIDDETREERFELSEQVGEMYQYADADDEDEADYEVAQELEESTDDIGADYDTEAPEYLDGVEPDPDVNFFESLDADDGEDYAAMLDAALEKAEADAEENDQLDFEFYAAADSLEAGEIAAEDSLVAQQLAQGEADEEAVDALVEETETEAGTGDSLGALFTVQEADELENQPEFMDMKVAAIEELFAEVEEDMYCLDAWAGDYDPLFDGFVPW
jgi:lipopolysaccharide export system protein LptA